MPSSINPANVKWRFFYKNAAGEIVAADEIPEGKKPVALINSSTFPVGKSATPAHLKSKIKTALEHADAGGLCFALPCEDLAVMREYYGVANLDGTEDDYVRIRMHDDLMKGNKDFLPHELRFERTMPAKEGAEQLASAIEKGFDIWSYNSGGNSIAPKLELCEEYFAENLARFPAKKVKFIGFSNGTSMAFHLRGIVDYALGYGLSYSFARIEGDADLQEQVSKLFHAFRGEDVEVKRKFGGVTAEKFRAIRDRRVAGAPITNVAVWLGQMVPAVIGKLPKFGADEKIILELEYSMHPETKGYEAGATLRRFLTSGAINPANILYVALGDFIDAAEENVSRKFGLIPEFGELSAAQQAEIRRLAEKKGVSAEVYISQSNARSQELMKEVASVAAEFGIPVIEGGERRVSHGKYSQLAPSRVTALDFDEEDWSMTQTCVFRSAEPVRADLMGERVMRRGAAVIGAADAGIVAKLSEAKLMPLTLSAASCAVTDKEEVVVGRPVDLAELDSEQIRGKGVVVYLPMVEGSISASEQFNAFQLSENYRLAKFVALVTCLPAAYSSDKVTMIINRNHNYHKLIADLGEAAPVFISKESFELDAVGGRSFMPFVCELDLKKMLAPGVELRGATSAGVATGTILARL